MSRINTFKYINSGNIKNALYHFRSFGMRSMLRKTLDYLEYARNYNIWRTHHTVSDDALRRQANTVFQYTPKISIIVPVYKTPADFLQQMIDSVISQSYTNWELCIADGSADTNYSYIEELISKYQAIHPSIRYKKLPDNLGISGNTNEALKLATGDYIGLLDHDDLLSPDALFEIVSALNTSPRPEILYTDEDKVDSSLQTYYDPYFKPDFNLDLLRSCNYITHFYVVKKELALQAKGFSDECNGSQDYDFILKTCDLSDSIVHISKVLYHWRIHPASVAGDPESKTYAYDSAVRALQSHLNRNHENAVVSRDTQFGYYRVTYSFPGTPLVSIVLKDCSPKLKEQLQRVTAYSNYEFIDSPDQASGQFLLILYHVKEILTSDWIQQMLGNCCRNSVGIVSPKVYYKKDRMLHAGLVYTPDGHVHSPFYKLYSNDTGYCYRARIQQNCSLVTPHCFMLETSLFKNLFHSTSNNFTLDILELCRAVSHLGLSIVVLPSAAVRSVDHSLELPVLEYYKGKSDPYYNPNFSTDKMYHLS